MLVHVVEQAALFFVAHHAFTPEKAGHAVAAGHRLDAVHAGAGAQNHVACGQLHRLRAEGVFDPQFAAVIAIRLAQEQGAADVGVNTRLGKTAEKNTMCRFSAPSISCRKAWAWLLSCGSCSLFFTWADCRPAVVRPSPQVARPASLGRCSRWCRCDVASSKATGPPVHRSAPCRLRCPCRSWRRR